MGGRAAIEKVKTRTMTGTLALSTPAGDLPGTVEIYNAAPNKVRTVIKADLSQFGAGQLLIDQRFDGTNGYMINSMQGDQPITGNQLDNMKSNSFPHPFLDYKAKGVTVKMTGKEKVGDRDAYVLMLEPPVSIARLITFCAESTIAWHSRALTRRALRVGRTLAKNSASSA